MLPIKEVVMPTRPEPFELQVRIIFLFVLSKYLKFLFELICRELVFLIFFHLKMKERAQAVYFKHLPIIHAGILIN